MLNSNPVVLDDRAGFRVTATPDVRAACATVAFTNYGEDGRQVAEVLVKVTTGELEELSALLFEAARNVEQAHGKEAADSLSTIAAESLQKEMDGDTDYDDAVDSLSMLSGLLSGGGQAVVTDTPASEGGNLSHYLQKQIDDGNFDFRVGGTN